MFAIDEEEEDTFIPLAKAGSKTNAGSMSQPQAKAFAKPGMAAFLDDNDDDEDDFIPKIKPISKPDMPPLPTSSKTFAMPPLPGAKTAAPLPPPPLPKAPTMAAPKKQATLWGEGDDDEEEEQSSFLKKPAAPLPPPPQKPINKFFGGDDEDDDEEPITFGKKPLPKMAMPIPAAKQAPVAAPPLPPRKTNTLFDSVVSQGEDDVIAPPKLPMPKVAPPQPPTTTPPKPNLFKSDYGDEEEENDRFSTTKSKIPMPVPKVVAPPMPPMPPAPPKQQTYEQVEEEDNDGFITRKKKPIEEPRDPSFNISMRDSQPDQRASEAVTHGSVKDMAKALPVMGMSYQQKKLEERKRKEEEDRRRREEEEEEYARLDEQKRQREEDARRRAEEEAYRKSMV
jgi:hypothetical protein